MIRQLVIVIGVVCLASSAARAGEPSKEACVDAHSRGQDANAQGKLTLARKLFMTCAQSSCPTAVQSDCARFADDLTNMQPTIVFVARDGDGNDLPNTAIYVDGVLIVTQLDGKPHDIDPGQHTVRFAHAGRDEIVTVVIGSGEKGRTVLARLEIAPSTRPSRAVPQRTRVVDAPITPARPKTATTTHPTGSVALAVTGGLVAAGGIGLAIYGRSRVPGHCSLTTHECSAPPGDPVFAQAATATRTMNLGIVVGGAGAAALVGGLVWYVAGARTSRETATQVAPIVTRDGGGVSVVGRF